MAARYVHQLAKEVLSLLSGIADEIEMHHKIRKLAEERLSDWDRNFPSSLKVIGGPQEVAQRLFEMQSELNKLYSQIEDYEIQFKEKQEKDQQTIDDQLYLSSVSVMRERDQMANEVNKIKSEYQERMKLQEERYQEEIRRLHQQYQQKNERMLFAHKVCPPVSRPLSQC
jgi:hypothetical protein